MISTTEHQGVKPLMLCFLLLIWAVSPGFGQAQVRKEVTGQQQRISEFSDAYARKDADLLKTMLSPDFAVGLYGRSHEDFLLNVLTGNFACDSIRFVRKRGRDRAEVLMYRTDGSRQDAVFTFDGEGLVRYVDAFDRLYGVDRDGPSTLVKTIPFEEQNGSIILRCRINDSDRELRLLFDTGADGMALSTDMGQALGLKVTRTNSASVVGGHMQIQVSDNNTVHIGDFVFPNQGIALFGDIRGETDGIIGNTLLKRYIVHVDYDKKELSLFSMGKHKFGRKGTTLPVVLDGNLHLPISLVMNGGKPYEGRVYFDTGASYNLILFRPFVVRHRLLVDGFKPLSAGSTVSMGMSSPTYTGLAQTLKIGDKLHTDDFLLSLMAGSGQEGSWAPEADGSLGVGIIGRYNFTVNLLDRKIHFEPNQRYNMPSDFVFGDYFFHHDLNGQLLMSKILDTGTTNLQVTRLNGTLLEDWLKNTRSRRKYRELIRQNELVVEAGQDGVHTVITLTDKN